MIKTDIQVRFSDIDRIGHINNIVLQHYYDLGKMQYFNEIVGLPLIWEEEAFSTVNTNTNYYEEIRFGDKFYITTRVTKIGTKSLTISQDIIDYDTNVVKSHSDSVLVAFDLKKRIGIALRDEWRERITTHEM